MNQKSEGFTFYAILALSSPSSAMTGKIMHVLDQGRPSLDRMAKALNLELTPLLVACDNADEYLHPLEQISPTYFFEKIIGFSPRDVIDFTYGPRLALESGLVLAGVGDDTMRSGIRDERHFVGEEWFGPPPRLRSWSRSVAHAKTIRRSGKRGK